MRTKKLHYATANRPKFTDDKAELFLNLFTDKTLQTLARLHFVEAKTLLQCSEEMNYSVRQVKRLNGQLKDIAIKSLINLISDNNIAEIKLLQIKQIVNEVY